ncbi:MAG TPA: N-6 DNA methylase, partial [Chryseolinea sp.]|nr:N-6 DNA methylase [Chryseolinea sp.]
AANNNQAKDIHKKVWNQSLAPFLLILTPETIWSCQGFSFSSKDWDKKTNKYAEHISWSAIETPFSVQLAPADGEAFTLKRYHAYQLRSSITWRDYALNVGDRVDIRLLQNLELLCNIFVNVKIKNDLIKLKPETANALIGRFLYIYFLYDREIITRNWLYERGHTQISLEDDTHEWPLSATWAFFDDIDAIFNGNIFPISKAARKDIDKKHIHYLRAVLRHGAEPTAVDGLQLSFIDFYFGSIRTETLSAVYELFLKNIDPAKKRSSGAYYTPPFLVDYVLDRVEEALPLKDGVKTMDSAAGSGAFLVGVYRRIIEKQDVDLNAEHQPSLEHLKHLLTDNIYGIEFHNDACHVASFSLYLTMLDYVRPRDLEVIMSGRAGERLFPEMINCNILQRDFFNPDAFPAGFPKKFDCIVGNPPWCKTNELDSVHIRRYQEKHEDDMPIGDYQVAELFVWKNIKEHLKKGGIAGLLIPVKSFVNEKAEVFSRKIANDLTVIGVANLAHFRKHLFKSAKHPAAALIIKNETPLKDNILWSYSPLLVGQPTKLQKKLWGIIVDRADVEFHRQQEILARDRGWLDALLLRPIDRRIIQYFENLYEYGRATRLGDLAEKIGLQMKQGKSKDRTGIAAEFQLSADESSPFYYKKQLKVDVEHLFNINQAEKIVPLPEKIRKEVKAGFSRAFAGRILLIPRKGGAYYVEPPVAFNGSFNSIFFETPYAGMSNAQVNYLKAMEASFSTTLYRYFAPIIGRRVLIDRENIELTSLRTIPAPFVKIDDPYISKFLSFSDGQKNDFIFDKFGITGDYRVAIDEFVRDRIGFIDGGVPDDATNCPTKDELKSYKQALQRHLNRSVGVSDAYQVTSYADNDRLLCAVEAKFIDSPTVTAKKTNPIQLGHEALSIYDREGGDIFTNSLFQWHDRENSRVVLVKPLERYHWTSEKAFSDSEAIYSTIMKSSMQQWITNANPQR